MRLHAKSIFKQSILVSRNRIIKDYRGQHENEAVLSNRCWMVNSRLNTVVICFRGAESVKDIWRFSSGPNVLKRVRFFPGNGDWFSFNGGWLEGSFTVELACGGSQALLGIEKRSLSLYLFPLVTGLPPCNRHVCHFVYNIKKHLLRLFL